MGEKTQPGRYFWWLLAAIALPVSAWILNNIIEGGQHRVLVDAQLDYYMAELSVIKNRMKAVEDCFVELRELMIADAVKRRDLSQTLDKQENVRGSIQRLLQHFTDEIIEIRHVCPEQVRHLFIPLPFESGGYDSK